ncbi:S-DNA-T family DNA segregation ATPase FtsK/SpoIIIE [Actinoplanes lutulentus]|uniref:S-DNA-T family DNA segregation ATPase FtsK/SpoIIIE n=1 Tax=Actinoplanes lutulentus TaxID=1287878 RepID=A0A327ZJU3_9ACTN|nr:type VII secretion protein EccCa [Actinoplanes lutulentus]MBB2940608.1 S-DNA-T family DNA segregation ATPase FtsK/SpoIIIE [Actinoplanes lutulentus]RAK42919.1 S-DNA-T family DNA segregation ATPase FtsK/SpoIIIE [Actinoplanes lutulentus]
MATAIFKRPARRSGPEAPSGELSLQEPPELAEQQSNAMRTMLMVLPMALMGGVMALMFTTGSSRGGSMNLMMSGLMVVAMGAMMLGQLGGGGDRKQRAGAERRDYLRHLAQNRRRARQYVDQQREAALWRDPDPRALWTLAMTSRRWERRPSHPDFLEVRVGTGEQRLAVRIAPLQTKPIEDLEPLSAKSLRRFIRAYSTVQDLPVALFLPGFAEIRVGGDPSHARALVRTLIAQLVTLHAPEEVTLALCVGTSGADAWEWAKWLPHLQHAAEQDAAGQVRLVADGIDGIERMLGDDFLERPRYERDARVTRDEPYVVVIRDGGRLPNGARFTSGGYRNTLLIDLDTPTPSLDKEVLTLHVDAERLEMIRLDRVGSPVHTLLAAPDFLGEPAATALARLLSPYRLALTTEPDREALTTDFDLPSLLGIADPRALNLGELWSARPAAQRLRVPIGVDRHGTPIELDLKESALGGSGPHGMLIGATGSGKSELLRTLVVALATTHSSETLNFVLVDFKGGATFLGLDELPHTSAVITNLADEAALVGRMRDALQGELVRRQELLRAVGGYSSVLDYEKARSGGVALDPLPTLFIVVDEFSELLATHRDFIDLFVMIGRLGRSLGVHLLLASQRVDDGRIGQLESHLSYRIGLRTFSALESRSVIGVPDAYELPSAPGNGYLRTDVSTLVRFKAAYVSGSYRPRAARVRQEIVQRQVVPYLLEHVPHRHADPLPAEPDAKAAPDDAAEQSASVMSVMVTQLAGQGPPAHQVWLPPLAAPPTLDQLLPALEPDSRRGLVAARWPGNGRLVAPVGYVDRPAEQARELLVVDLSGVGGHLGIAGGPQSGKSTLLRSVIAALALTHSPAEVQFYCLDFGGGTLASIAGLPHVGSVAGRLDEDRVRRTVAEITALIARRERVFADRGIDSMATYRRQRAAGEIIDDPYGDVFLVVDGWFTLRQEFEAVDAAVRQITARGLNFGVHLLLTASRWSEVHHGMRDQVGTRLELRLGDPVDSTVDLRLAATVPQIPGRGLTSDKLHFLGALPRIDGVEDPDSAADGARDLATSVADFWPGEPAPPVRTLPAVLDAGILPAPEGDFRVPFGLDEERMSPVWHHFGEVPHLTVLGDVESGKSNLLRHLIRSICARFAPGEARILLVDYRRTLFDAIPDAYRLGYSVSAESTRATVADALAGLRPRVPGADISPEQLRRRDWWTGPRLFVLVDDYEMLSGMDSPLQALVPMLQHGADIGFHLVLTRGASNLSRMSMDPLIRRLQETNSPDVALSCPPTEGPLLGGAKPRHLPPGRALLCSRRGHRLIQTAWSDPAVVTVDAAAPTGR